MPPQAATVDDEYGLESAKPATGVTDDKYGLEPAKNTGTSGAPKTEAERQGVTPAPGTPPMKPQTETQSEKSTHEGDRGVLSGVKSSLPSIGSVARRLMFGGIDPVSDYGMIKGLGDTGQNIKAGAASARETTPQDPNHPLLNKFNQDVSSVMGGTAGALSPLVGVSPVSQRERALKADTGGVVGENILPTAMALTPVAKEVPGKVGRLASAIARDPITGELKPGAVTTGKVGGAILGGAAGVAGGEALLGGPNGHNIGGGIYGGVQGARAGLALGPALLDKAIPSRAIYPGASLPSYEEFAANHGEDLTKRGRAQGKIDTANEKRLKETEDTRQQQLADRGKLEMQDATEQAAAIRRQQVLDAKNAPTKPGPLGNVSLPTQLQGSSTLSTAGGGPSPKPVTVTPMTPPQTMPVVKTKAQIAAEAEPKIVQPGGIPSEGRPATWTDETVQTLARLGDPDAVAQVRNRLKGTDPLNPGRIPLSYPTVETSPKSVTKFGPGGEPVEEPVTPRGGGEPSGIPVLQPPVVRPTPSARMARAFVKPAGVPQAPTLNFEQAIPVPSEAPAKPLTPPVAEDVPRETIQTMQKPAVPPEGVSERRQSLRDMNGPDFTRTALMNDLRKNIAAETDPAVRKTLEDRLADIKANPFEKHEGGDLNSMKAQKTVSREEAEANTEARKAGRTQRFGQQEGVLPGMAEHVAKQEEGAARVKGEDLTREANTPKSIESAAGEMERKSPLFRGTAASPQGELLKPMEKLELAPGTKVLHTFDGEEGTRAEVAKIDKGFSVGLRDTDAGQMVGLTKIYTTEAEAVDAAKKLASGKDIAPMQKPTVEEPEAKEVHIKGITAKPPKTGTPAVKKMVKPKPTPIEAQYSPEEIIEAEGTLAQEAGMMATADRPGVYFDQGETTAYGRQGGWKTGLRSGGQWRGVKSGRDMYPFMRDNPDLNPQQVLKAIRNKDSSMYHKVMTRMLEHIRKLKANTGDAAELGERVLGEEEFPPKD